MSAPARELSGDKAQRIVDAMRESVAHRGVAGSTFDHVAREAGVSRGLLHYYFGSKERLLVEVARREADVRLAALDATLVKATSAQDLIRRLARSFRAATDQEQGIQLTLLELRTLARRQEDVATELADLLRQMTRSLGDRLRELQRDGVVRLAAEPEAVATMLFAIADGLSLRILGDPTGVHDAALEAGTLAARSLLLEP